VAIQCSQKTLLLTSFYFIKEGELEMEEKEREDKHEMEKEN